MYYIHKLAGNYNNSWKQQDKPLHASPSSSCLRSATSNYTLPVAVHLFSPSHFWEDILLDDNPNTELSTTLPLCVVLQDPEITEIGED